MVGAGGENGATMAAEFGLGVEDFCVLEIMDTRRSCVDVDPLGTGPPLCTFVDFAEDGNDDCAEGVDDVTEEAANGDTEQVEGPTCKNGFDGTAEATANSMCAAPPSVVRVRGFGVWAFGKDVGN